MLAFLYVIAVPLGLFTTETGRVVAFATATAEQENYDDNLTASTTITATTAKQKDYDYPKTATTTASIVSETTETVHIEYLLLDLAIAFTTRYEFFEHIVNAI